MKQDTSPEENRKFVAAVSAARSGRSMVPRILVRLGLLLLIGGAGSCITGEGACHRRAIAALGCCPGCDENCEVSKSPEAMLALDECLADLAERRQEVEQADTSDDGGTTAVGDDGETTFDSFW